MNFKYFKQFLTITILLLFSTICKAEIIEIQKEEKQFGDWQVLCEIDLMMNISDCKIASKFYSQTSVITIDPSSKISGQVMLIIPQIKIGSLVQLRVDTNDLIFSNNVDNSDFGMIPLSREQKFSLVKQIEKGDFLFIRFAIRGEEQEITARIDLKDFRKAISYYQNKIQ